MIDFAHDELILENVNNSKSLELQGAGEENFRSEDPDCLEGSPEVKYFDEKILFE